MAEAREMEQRQIHQQFGWFFLAKQVADYTNTTYFQVMDTPAQQVFGLVNIIRMENKYHSLSHGRKNA
ncbi:MAG: hypothetical protein EOO97_00125 [Pedobacter sp.]|nr:MAG: hypothetical protein EOO97_00125 [Pedobacter sp.]